MAAADAVAPLGEKKPLAFTDTGFFRSEPMQYLKFLLPKDCAHRVLHRFGELACLHFVDLQGSDSGASGSAQMEAKKRALLASSFDRRLSAVEDKVKECAELELEPFDSDLLSAPQTLDSSHVDALGELEVH